MMARNGINSTKNQQQLEAAVLVAEGVLSERQIAERVGIGVRTVARWKDDPLFRVMVAAERDRLAAEIRRVHIADKQTRLDAMVARHRAILEIISERAAAYVGQAPGAGSGLLMRKVALIKVYEAGELDDDGEPVDRKDGNLYSAKHYREVPEFVVDKALLAELREIEASVAKELGQIINKSEVAGPNGGPVVVQQRVENLSDDELDRRISELESQVLRAPEA